MANNYDLGIDGPVFRKPLKWEAQVPGVWNINVRVKDDEGRWVNKRHDLSKLIAIFDFANMEVLHVRFPGTGEPPQRINIRPAGTRLPKRPESPNPKTFFSPAVQALVKVVEGVEVRVPSHVFELLGTNSIVCDAIKDAWKSFKEQEREHPGELPLIEHVGTKDIQTEKGTLVQPVLKIVGWVARPDDLPDSTISAERDEPVLQTDGYRDRNGGHEHQPPDSGIDYSGMPPSDFDDPGYLSSFEQSRRD